MTEPVAPTLDLDAIEARANEAAPGPWIWTDADYRGGQAYTADVSGATAGSYRIAQGITVLEDAEFIAHAREDVPALIAAVRAVDARVSAALELHPIHVWGRPVDGYLETHTGCPICRTDGACETRRRLEGVL